METATSNKHQLVYRQNSGRPTGLSATACAITFGLISLIIGSGIAALSLDTQLLSLVLILFFGILWLPILWLIAFPLFMFGFVNTSIAIRQFGVTFETLMAAVVCSAAMVVWIAPLLWFLLHPR